MLILHCLQHVLARHNLENERASHVLGDVIQHLRVAAHQAQQPEVSGAGVLLCSVGEGVHHVNDDGWRVGMAVCRVGLRGDSYSLPLCNTVLSVLGGLGAALPMLNVSTSHVPWGSICGAAPSTGVLPSNPTTES